MDAGPKSLAEAIAVVTAAFTEAAKAAAESVGRFLAPVTLRQRRIDHGGMAREARDHPDEWMSAVCAGLICSITKCPSDVHDLRCNCPCHRKDER